MGVAVWSFVHAADPSGYSPRIDLVLRSSGVMSRGSFPAGSEGGEGGC